jgi:hypothetical protein
LAQYALAGIPETTEYKALQEINTNIESYNRQRRAEGHKGNKGFKLARKAEQLFKFVELKCETAKGGIDWWIYRNEVLLKRLIPYYEAVQRRHGGKVYSLCQDGVPYAPHVHATRPCPRQKD